MKKIILISLFLVSFTPNYIRADNLPVFDVNLVVITGNPQAHQVATRNQLMKEVDILNKYFVTESRERIVRFRFKSAYLYDEIKDSNCEFIRLGDTKRPYDSNGWASIFNECKDHRVRVPNAINFYVYDSYSKQKGFSDITSHGKRNSNRPYVLIDWKRLNHRTQSPEEHEMGHAFGLGHECVPGATINSHTNIMSSANNCDGSGGRRDIGFNAEQVKTIKKYAAKIQERLDIKSNTTWGGAGDLPVGGDFNRDGRGDRAVFRPSDRTWYFDYDLDNVTDHKMHPWAVRGDLPIAGDFDRDGQQDDIGVFRPSDRTWYYDFNHDGTTDQRVRPWAVRGDLPVAGDFDGDGKYDDVAVFRPSDRTWYYDFDHDGTTDQRIRPWAVRGDIPFAGNFDGDGKYDDVGVYRKSDNTKYIDLNHNGTTDGTGRAGTGKSNCLPVVISNHIWLFCDGEWWAQDPDSTY